MESNLVPHSGLGIREDLLFPFMSKCEHSMSKGKGIWENEDGNGKVALGPKRKI